MATNTNAPTVGSLFAGIGGFELAFSSAGFEPSWSVEIDKDCRTVLRRHFPDSALFDDVQTVGAHNLTPVDVLVGGFPCQDVSVAGNRKGLGGHRSGLFWEMLRIADELRPSYLVWENVPGLLTTCSCRECGRRCFACGTLAGADDEECGTCGGGKFRGRVLPDHRGADFFTIVSALGFIGMDGAWTLLDAQWFGVPQRRQRLFGVFTQRYLGAERCAEILSFTTRLSGDTPPSREAGAGIAASIGASTEAGGAVGPLLGGHAGGHRIGADEAAGGHIIPILEAGARQGTTADKRDGLGVGEPGDPMFTLQGSKQHAVFGTTGQSARRSDQITLSASDDNGSNAVCITGAATHALTSDGSDASEDGTGRGTPVVIRFGGDYGDPTVSIDDKAFLAANPMSDRQMAIGAPDTSGYGVRRLTPLECERLQGFPDGWTDGISDSGRYRMLGNSVAVPCVQWIAERMFAQMGSN